MLFALAVGLLLVAHNNLLALGRLPDRLYLPLNVALGIVLIAAARMADLSWEEIGLGANGLGPGLRWGVPVAAAVTLASAVALRIPSVRALFADRRLAPLTPRSLAFRALVRMPVGTSAFEEVAFRGVLFGALAREVSVARAVVISALLFGLSHIGPALAMVRANPGRIEPAVMVAVTVLATTIAGVLFALLRVRTSGIVASALAHWAANGAGAVGGWVAVRRPVRGRFGRPPSGS